MSLILRLEIIQQGLLKLDRILNPFLIFDVLHEFGVPLHALPYVVLHLVVVFTSAILSCSMGASYGCIVSWLKN